MLTMTTVTPKYLSPMTSWLTSSGLEQLIWSNIERRGLPLKVLEILG